MQIFYLFRHPTPLHERKYINYDYMFRKYYNPNLYTDVLAIYRLIRKLSPDIIYKQGVNYIAAVGVHYARRYKIPMILHIASQRDVEKSKYQPGIKGVFDFMSRNIATVRNKKCEQNHMSGRVSKHVAAIKLWERMQSNPAEFSSGS